MLSCLLRPTAGTATILGHDVRTEPLAVKRVTAISPQETAIAEHLDAWENLALMAGVHGIDKEVTRERSDELLETMALTKRGKEKAKHYSGGMKRRLSIAMALITEPQVVFLDEPTIGLGPQSRRGMWEGTVALIDRGTRFSAVGVRCPVRSLWRAHRTRPRDVDGRGVLRRRVRSGRVGCSG